VRLRTLFGLVKATEWDVLDEIERYFAPRETERGVQLPWSLTYGVAEKPPR
jgi:hypothetical protein